MIDLTGQMLLDRYHIRNFIGSGGMARVYQAWDAKRAAFVAIKLLNEDMSEDAVFLRRFAREARALEVLEHPHIVRFFGFEETHGLAFLVMEFIEGVTLRRYLHLLRRPLALPETLYVTQPVCSALHYAHQMGVYHCDVKPANIFIERGGRVVLADFGIAQLSESATVTFSTPGTPAYMSPEQCQGTEDLDARADIYSLGVTTYEMLTLDRPFKGEADGTTGGRGERVRWEQIHLPPPPPRSVNPHISPSAEAAILRSLEKAPGRRQQGALDFHRELSGSGAMEPVDSLPWVEGLQAPPSGVELPPPPPPPHKKPLPARGIGVVVGGVGIVVLAVLLLALIPRIIPPTPTPPLTRDAATATARVTRILPTYTLIPSPMYTPEIEPTWTPSLPSSAAFTPTPMPTPTPSPVLPPTTCRSGTVISWPQDDAELVCVPEGEFVMGSNSDHINDVIQWCREAGGHSCTYGEFSNETPKHSVWVDAFFIDRTEVTNRQYQRCVAAGACTEPLSFGSNTRRSYYSNASFGDYPVIHVSWRQARDYCEWAGRRLPSEAEWEKAARGTDGRVYPWGSASPGTSLANFLPVGRSPETYDTTRVGSYPSGASPYGALDMAGNVWEWVWDWFGQTYYETTPFRNPPGPSSGSEHVIRGGAWYNKFYYLRTTNRGTSADPHSMGNRIGFRCAVLVDEVSPGLLP